MTSPYRHNFYVFPRQELSGRATSCEFLCQTASIDFLARHQFDFNLCIREGIAVIFSLSCNWNCSIHVFLVI